MNVATSTAPSARQVWRAARTPIVIVLLLLLLAVISAALHRQGRVGYLDPAAPSPQGGRALAAILRDRGVTVRVAHGIDDARSAAGPDTTVLVTRPEMYSGERIDALHSLPGDRVLVAPTPDMLRRLAPGVRIDSSVLVQPREPSCRLSAARAAGPADMGGAVYTVQAGDGAPPALCYPIAGRASLVQLTVQGRTVTVLGAGSPLTNEYLDERGNAALALNLLDSNSTLIWLWPTTLPPPSGERQRSPWELIPNQVGFALVQLAVAVVLVALWRARRLGSVVTEPLPVVVRAAETVEGRGRLYRARRARDSAAEALRRASRSRIIGRLGLSHGSSVDEVVAAVTARTGRTATAVHGLLYGAAPGDDATLVRLASDLDTLEEEVLCRSLPSRLEDVGRGA